MSLPIFRLYWAAYTDSILFAFSFATVINLIYCFQSQLLHITVPHVLDLCPQPHILIKIYNRHCRKELMWRARCADWCGGLPWIAAYDRRRAASASASAASSSGQRMQRQRHACRPHAFAMTHRRQVSRVFIAASSPAVLGISCTGCTAEHFSAPAASPNSTDVVSDTTSSALFAGGGKIRRSLLFRPPCIGITMKTLDRACMSFPVLPCTVNLTPSIQCLVISETT